jgi:hypothetical protein
MWLSGSLTLLLTVNLLFSIAAVAMPEANSRLPAAMAQSGAAYFGVFSIAMFSVLLSSE